MWDLEPARKMPAYLGGMVVIEFEGYGALWDVSEFCTGWTRTDWCTIVVSKTMLVAIAAQCYRLGWICCPRSSTELKKRSTDSHSMYALPTLVKRRYIVD